MSIQAHTYQRHILQSTEQLDRWSNDIPCLFNNKASIPSAASMVLMLHRKYGKLHGVKGLFFFLPFYSTTLSYHAGHRELRDLACSCVYQEGREERSTASWFPKFFQMDYTKAQRSNQYLNPSNSICPFFWLHPGFGNQHLIFGIRTNLISQIL